MDRLKELISMNDYLDELGTHNDRIADQAIDLRKMEAAGTPNKPIGEVAEDMRRRLYTCAAQQAPQYAPSILTRQTATNL